MTELESFSVNNMGVQLRVYAMGPPHAPPLVALHGMQDVALSLRPVVDQLATDFRVYLPEMRGHGSSDRPGHYSMLSYVFDLHRVLDTLNLEAPMILGHSLGGQLAIRLAAMFPTRVKSLVAVEALGPPFPSQSTDTTETMQAEGRRLLATFSAHDRTLASREDAASRLRANNPRLDDARSLWLATLLTEDGDDGQLRWAFDTRVRGIFIGPEDAYRYWPHVQCPTLLMFGEHSHEYWSSVLPSTDGKFSDGELEGRISAFPHARSITLEASGHMAHLDEPDRIASEAYAFFETNGYSKSLETYAHE